VQEQGCIKGSWLEAGSKQKRDFMQCEQACGTDSPRPFWVLYVLA